ncbi:GPW/gp25 family protein [Archangium lansingense]|uniref:GPW/gp25 family protein n=2 Tax=Archangiaceae TaxID=39 RepID=A0ABT4AAH4_9BACT|nr:GPW/gp25 family protein [Archangium lansinium]MCY1078677.1 GPW/gp25 family protein [Archangium lansinium]
MSFLSRRFLGREETLLEEVLRNLHHLLNAKRGAASFLPGFGLSETGFRTAEEMLGQLGAEIRENIRLYEPRVEVTEIEEDYEGENGRLRLVVHCRLRHTAEPLSVLIDPYTRAMAVAPQTQPEEE